MHAERAAKVFPLKLTHRFVEGLRPSAGGRCLRPLPCDVRRQVGDVDFILPFSQRHGVADGVFALVEGHMGRVTPEDDQALVVLRS